MSAASSSSSPPPSSLILAHRPQSRSLLILGSSKLAASRARTALESGAIPIVVGGLSAIPPCDEVKRLIAERKVRWQDISSHDDVDILRGHAGSRSDIEARWGALIDDLDGSDRSIFAACVTDTLHDGDDDAEHAHHQGGSADTSSSVDRAALLAHVCRRRRIPINVTDKPLLCDFSFPATHRFPASSSPLLPHADGSKAPSSMSSLQIAVTTNGRGCRLAGRIRREIVSALPRNVGDAVERVGEMRDLAKGGEGASQGEGMAQTTGFFEEAAKLAAAKSLAQTPDSAPHKTSVNSSAQSSRRGSTKGTAELQEDDLNFDTTPLNSPVPQLSTPASRSGLPTHSRQHSHTNLTSALRTTQMKTAAVDIEAAIRADKEEAAEKTKRRMRWVAQISEYWPMEYLGGMGPEQMREALRSFGEEEEAAGLSKSSSKLATAGEVAVSPTSPEAAPTNGATSSSARHDEETSSRGRSRAAPFATSNEDDSGPLTSTRPRARSQHSLAIVPPPPPRSVAQGHIYLVGSGPGHPGLLTLLGHRLLTSPSTHLVLSDKLVPAPILRLIPATTPLIIAKKFPGNAEGAQSELISLALKAALEEGKNVVRLKQGDPFVYGRGGEEVLAFREKGVECTVVPGISSAIAAPLMVGLPVTQRGSADSLVLCTGVGRGGKKVKLPGYDRGRSLIVLMGVARLGAVVDILTKGYGLPAGEQPQSKEEDQDRTGPPFPPHTPIAIIERASSSDQRLLASTLSGILSALESSGEQRPPGMILIGWAVLALEGKGNVDVLDDEHECLTEIGGEEGQKELKRRDEERVKRWLNGREYVVREGLDAVYAKALADLAGNVGEDDKNGDAGAGQALPPTGNGERTAEPTNGSATDAAAGPLRAVDGHATAAAVEVDHSLSSRSSTGWAQGRYTGTGKPEGGWSQGEKRFIETDGGVR
ncbi:hypothetical protein BCV69DRAFT_284859 [Microstroma glucosiphilum]|uniref:precorrin-2 dehydrogenase n=1 Tax=Pseudomicrostroma glucosiphilum TaxID=1684307 RepID=A0A316U6G8_9BASI|nr:hypothetical protein BCV69DRAFT_284859 [Pseudomicrostroma glucosiphilum]PWN18555.1 hypothetical protein BCV69DRAFT_284859 [Pseudomicrostroma glucosiphilum]